VLGGEQAKLQRQERLRQLAMETIDLNKDPYFMRNHLGTFECKLCATIHRSEANYLAHTQGRRHQLGLSRRAARDAKEKGETNLTKQVQVRRYIKIGRPGYKVSKLKDPETGKRGLQFELVYPEIKDGLQPRQRMMSAFEQKVGPADPKYQYMLFAAEPYETIGFRIPNRPLEKSKFETNWDSENTTFTLTCYFI